MKAYELHPEEGFPALKLVERPEPALGAHDVCVRVRAVALNHRDLVIARASKDLKKPIVPVSDGAGEVLRVGEKVTSVKIGDRVAASFFPTWMDGQITREHHARALGGTMDGMLIEQVVLPETAWVKIPARLSFEQASTLPCAGLTAWHALFEASDLKPGEIVLVQGSGGVSIFALQLARSAGARVIATSSSAAKRARLEQLGAESTIDYKDNQKWGDAARAATGGRGVDIVVEVGGAGTFEQSVKALRFGGAVSVIGILTGKQGVVDLYALLHKNIRATGIYVGSVAMFERFLRAVETSQLEPVIDRVFAFNHVPAAYEYFASGGHFGKIVIRMD